MSVFLIRNIRRRIDNQRGCFVEVRFGGKGFHIMIDRYRLAFLIELLFACFIIQFIFAVKALKLENKIILAFAGNRPYDDILGILSCRAMRHRQFEFCSIGIRNPVQIIDTLFGNRQILDFEGEEAVDGIGLVNGDGLILCVRGIGLVGIGSNTSLELEVCRTGGFGKIDRYINRADTVSVPVDRGGRDRIVAFNEVDQRIANCIIFTVRHGIESWQILEDGLLGKVDRTVVGSINTVGIGQ